MNPCVNAKPQGDSPGDPSRYMHIHNRFILETKEKEPDVVFLGDSITSQLETRYLWRDIFMPMHALNFSIVGDTTQNILWRAQNGELENINPKVIVIYAGGNNLSNDPVQIVEGIVHIANIAHEKQPNAHILVQKILPRGLKPNPARDCIEKVNQLLDQKLEDNPIFELIPVGEGLIQNDGSISQKDMYDWFYPTNEGFLKAFDPLISRLTDLLTVKTGIEEQKSD